MSTKPESQPEPGPETDSAAGTTRDPRDAPAAPQPHPPAATAPSSATAAPTDATAKDAPRGAAASEPTAEPQPEPAPTRRRPDPRSAAALIFDDPLSQRSSDDTDRGWGERPTATGGAADLARFLDEKPPHHL